MKAKSRTLILLLLFLIFCTFWVSGAIFADQATTDSVFEKLATNDQLTKSATFTINNPAGADLPKNALSVDFIEKIGQITEYKLFVKKEVLKTTHVPIYDNKEICTNLTNCTIQTVIVGNNEIQSNEIAWIPVDSIPKGLNEYRIEAKIKPISCGGLCYKYSVDWIPKLDTGNIIYSQNKWAWWNATYNLSTGLFSYFDMDTSGSLISRVNYGGINYGLPEIGSVVLNTTDSLINASRGNFTNTKYFLNKTLSTSTARDMTVNLWFKRTTTGATNYDTLIEKSNAADNCRDFFITDRWVDSGLSLYVDGKDFSCDMNVPDVYYHLNTWTMVTLVKYTNLSIRLYQNATLLPCSDYISSSCSGSDILSIGQATGGTGYPGLFAWVDEVAIWEGVALNQTQIDILWNNGQGLKYEPTNPNANIPSVIFNNQTPADLNVSNIITQEFLTSYNTTLLNDSNSRLVYRTNNSAASNVIYINGSLTSGESIKSCQNQTESGFNCALDDNEVLPATYNTDPQTMEDTAHIVYNLTTSSSYISTTIYNISQTIGYGFYEGMFNKSDTTAVLSYYCNSSYITGSPVTSTSCAQISAIVNSSVFDHAHEGLNSRHHVVSFGITGGLINGIKVTPVGYFLQRGDSSTTTYIWGIAKESRPDTMRVSINGGTSWANIAGFSSDSHLHQIANDTRINFYGSAYSDTDKIFYNSSIKTDFLTLMDLPPNEYFIFDIPAKIPQNKTNLVNWTASNSPLNRTINYTLRVLNQVNYSLKRILTNSTNETFFSYNASDSLGFYYLQGTAFDSAGITTNPIYGNLFEICAPYFNCTGFYDCGLNNISVCYSVSDLNSCDTFAGVVTDYNKNCSYVIYTPFEVDINQFNLNTFNNVFLLFVMIFLWIGVWIITFVFRNKLFGTFGFVVGVFIGFMFLSIHVILTIMFLILSAMLMMRSGK